MEYDQSIIRCPNCGYATRFIESRLRYKCGFCKKNFLQKEAENHNFRQWNSKQLENKKNDVKIEMKKPRHRRKIFTDEEMKEKKNKWAREYQIKNKQKLKQSRRTREATNEELYETKAKILKLNKAQLELARKKIKEGKIKPEDFESAN